MEDMKFLSVEETAKILSVSARTVRQLIRSKKILAVKVGREWRIAEEDLRKYVAERKTKSDG